jgi:hypothetical protein
VLFCGAYRSEACAARSALAELAARAEAQRTNLRFQPRAQLAREYGVRFFEPFLCVRLPRKHVFDFTRADAEALLTVLRRVDTKRLRENVKSVCIIADVDHREIPVKDFFNVFIAPSLSRKVAELWEVYVSRV